jgi:hypothetical protein
MDEVDRLTCDGTISHLADQLRWETSPDRQETLKRLLIAEEDRFGATEERLAMVERNLAVGADVIGRQAQIVAKLKNAGGDTGGAEHTLRTLESIQNLFENFRSAIWQSNYRRAP